MEAEISVPISELSAKKLFSKEQKPLQQMEDEFHPRQISILKPLLPSVIITKVDERNPQKTTTIDITEEIKDKFDYLSRTRNLEVDTPRTKILQEQVLDKMTKGKNIQTRVVIMNKGADAYGSVAPDGTVFVTQSLINKLDWLEEVGGFFNHEINHLTKKTPYHKFNAKTDSQRFGVGWIHEVAADQDLTPMENAGFNTFAFSTAIEKISGAERGTIHQSGLSRASQSVGHHLFIDRKTSDKPLTPIPAILKGEVQKTNLELINEIIEKEPVKTLQKPKEYLTGAWEKEFSAAVALLDKNDLERIYHSHAHSDKDDPLLNITEKLIMNRLQEQGYSKTNSVFFIMKNMYPHEERQGNLIKTVEEFNSIVDSMQDLENTDLLQKMYRQVFNQPPDKNMVFNHEPPAKFFMWALENHLYDINFEKKQNGIPVTQDALINAIDKINKINKSAS